MKKLFLALLFFLGLQHAALAASCSSYPFTLQNNTTADATQVMANFTQVRNCVINNAAGSGVNTDITSITGLTTPLSVPQGGTPVFIGGTSAGTANAQTVASTSPIGYALTSGYRVTFTVGVGLTNTGAVTLNVNSTGATAVRKLGRAGLEVLTGGEMAAGNIVEAIYNGMFFVLLSNPFFDIGPLTNILSAGTTDLGTVPSHNALITSTNTITAFGSSASTNEPIYLIKFNNALTLTYNATSLIIPGAASITTAANDTAVVEYLGSGNWQVLSYTKASGAGIVAITPQCGARALTVANNAGTPNTHIDMAAATAVMVNTSNVTLTANSVSVTINTTTTGANGLDAGALVANTWYYTWLINNGTTTAGLASTSATAPTMPSGYTFKCMLGAMLTDASPVFYRITQAGAQAQYKATAGTNTLGMWQLTSGAAVGNPGAGTWVAVTVAPTAVPTIASAIFGSIFVNNGIGMVAPNAAYGAYNSTTIPPPVSINIGTAGTASQFMFNMEATTIQWASNATGAALYVMGWRLPINAN